MGDLQIFCGLHNGSFTVWNKEGNSFNNCFLWTVTSYPSHILLTTICVYFLGALPKVHTYQKSLLLGFTNVIIFLLVVTSLLELVLSYALKQKHPTAYVLAKVFSFTAWVPCFILYKRTKSLVQQKKKENNIVLVGVLFVFASTGMKMYNVINHFHDSGHFNKSTTVDMYGSIIYFILNIMFFICCVSISFTRGTKTYKLRHMGNIQSVETSENTSLLSSTDSQAAYYEAYKRHKVNQTDIYLGKAESTSNIFSRLTLWWVNKLIKKGYHGQFQNPDDLYILPDTLDTNSIKERFSSILRIHRQKMVMQALSVNKIEDYQGSRQRNSSFKASLLKCLNLAFGKHYYSLGILKFLWDCFGFAGPILLNYLVMFMENKDEPMSHGYYYALGLFLSTLVSVILNLHYQYNIRKVQIQIRAALVTAIYEKTLNVSASSLSVFTIGQIVNFMSTDANRVSNFCLSFHEFWSLPFQIAVCLYLLYQQVGLAFLSGFGFCLLMIPLNRWLSKLIINVNKQLMKQKDHRVKLISEILNGIRIIKLYAWEKHFQEKIKHSRDGELKYLKKLKYLDAWCVYFWAATPVLISILTFTTYVALGNELTAAKVFTSIALFNMLIAPLNAFPWTINGLLESWVSLKRIEEYLALKEIVFDQYYMPMSLEEGDKTTLELERASFVWEQNGYAEVSEKSEEKENGFDIIKPFELKNISLFVQKGQLLGITGKVGSGKSSLFAAITAEMEKESGCVYIGEEFKGFALVSQEPWIQHLSLRDNILFGQPYDHDKYERVLYACSLNEDINILPAGDLTEVGENGVTLSGGQKARVSLARAVYQDKDVYLLDDPIAAVDSHVAAHIFKYCIMGLLKDKTRLLCTHHVNYLQHADSVIMLNDGAVKMSGHPNDVLAKYDVVIDGKEFKQPISEDYVTPENEVPLDDLSKVADKGKLVEEEEKAKGVVSFDVYKSYWKSVGNILAPSVLVFLLLMQASRNVGDWWLAYWISHPETSKVSNKTNVADHMKMVYSKLHISSSIKFYLMIYGAIAGANTIFTFFRAFLFAYGGIEAAKYLHSKLMNVMMHAPVPFFDVTPIGRIINRFSSDVYSIDDSLPFVMNIMLSQAFGVVGTIVISCYGLPWFTVVLIPLCGIYYYTQHYYRKTSRELKRMATVTLSPIHEQFSDTLAGLMTIRAFKESHRFISENERKLDFNQRANYSSLVAAIWIYLRLGFISVAMVTSVAFLAVMEHHFNSVKPGLVGLALSCALAITPALSGLIYTFTETEKQMISVERVVYYVNNTPKETEGTLYADNFWPQQGVICFRNVSLQYRDGLPNALNDVSFYVRAGEKIGICGRTGSGKSSLFRILFKTISLNHGEIIIDGVDIKNIHNSQVRAKMSIIPQDPFIFDDTIAMNLDPTETYTTFEMLDVLEKCHLKKVVQDLGGLVGMAGQKGQNFSTGQKQLLCLARALLKKAKIICIDEGTASVDFETDHLIQETIRAEFSSSTVLTIAHRIDTIMDCDRVLVMNAGRVMEFAPPSDLLSDHESMFFSLVAEHSAARK